MALAVLAPDYAEPGDANGDSGGVVDGCRAAADKPVVFAAAALLVYITNEYTLRQVLELYVLAWE